MNNNMNMSMGMPSYTLGVDTDASNSPLDALIQARDHDLSAWRGAGPGPAATASA